MPVLLRSSRDGAPTIEVANNAFQPARDMVRANGDLDDGELAELLHVQEHIRTITHRGTLAVLKVVAADSDTVAGVKAAFVLVDELWIFGKRPRADAMLREATGGLVSRPEGFVIFLTTQSDEEPAGVFKVKLDRARLIRDGKVVDPKSLPIIYEYPEDILEAEGYLDPANFYITNPNLGRSVDQEWLEDELAKVIDATGGEKQVFLAKHLNVEIGLRLAHNRWAGADFWEAAAEPVLTLEEILRRAEVATVGMDGGGLDDLFGFAVIGRCRETAKWMSWCRAWAHRRVLTTRLEIAPRLQDFAKDGDLIICDDPEQPGREAAELTAQVKEAGLLPEKYGVGLDPYGVADLVDELAAREIEGELVMAIRQGAALSPATWGLELKLSKRTLIHADQPLMDWCVGNAKAVTRGGAVLITKETAGRSKIDPLVALFNAAMLMSRKPIAKRKRNPALHVF